jgi:hypothetical protein
MGIGIGIDRNKEVGFEGLMHCLEVPGDGLF